MGLSCSEFWRLTWWEWGLRVLRFAHEQKKRKLDHEMLMGVTRIMIADFRNANKKKGTPGWKPQDIFKLSWDKKEKDKKIKTLTPEEVEKKFGKYGK